MGNRFHNKIHRKNHHTYSTTGYPDSGRDPIASPNEPFMGDFVLNGSISASPSLSAYAGYFSTDADNATTLILKSNGQGSLGLYVSGFNGLTTKSISGDSGYINISNPGNVNYPKFTNGYLALNVNGNALISNALSADSIWANTLYTLSSISLVTDLYISELSGFIVNGSDYNITIPDYINPNTQQLVLLNGIGLSGTSWASFGGDVNIKHDLNTGNITTTNIYISGDGLISNDLSINGDTTTTNIYISGDGLISNDLIVNGDITTTNMYISGDGLISNDLIVNGDTTTTNIYISGDVSCGSEISANIIYDSNSNSTEWGNTYNTVATLSSTWNMIGDNTFIKITPDIILDDSWTWTTSPSNINAIYDGDPTTHWGEASILGSATPNNLAYVNLSGSYVGWVFCLIDIKSSSGASNIGLYTGSTLTSAYIDGMQTDTVGFTTSTSYETKSRATSIYGNTVGLVFSVPVGVTAYYKIRCLEFYVKPII